MGEHEQDLAILQIFKCLRSIVVLTEVSGSSLALNGPEANICTVVDLYQNAILVQHDSCAVLILIHSTGKVLVEDQNLVSASFSSADLGVEQPLAFLNEEGSLIADLQDIDTVSLNLDHTGELGGQGAVGNAQGNGVLTGNIDVEATVADDGELLDLHIVSAIESAVIVDSHQIGNNCLFQVEVGIAQHHGVLGVAGNSGLLVNIGGQFCIGVSPVQTDHVAQLMDNALCHEAAAVEVEAFTEGAGLHNDCEATSGNGHSLCEVVSHLHFLAIHDDGSVGAGGIYTDGVFCIDQSAVGAVAAFDNHAVGVYDGNFTHLTADGHGDNLCGSVVEHAGQGLGGGEVSGQSMILCVLEVHQNAFPLTSGHVVLDDFQSQVGQRLQNNDGTGSGCLLVAQNGFVSNGVGAGDFSIEVAVIGHADAGAGQVGNNAHQDVQVIACVHLYGCGSNSQFQLITLALVVGLGGAGGAGNAGSAAAAVVRIATASGQREGQDQHQCQQHSNDGSCSFHGFLLNFIYHLTYLKS